MVDFKNLLLSRTVWFAIFGAVTGIAGTLGYELPFTADSMSDAIMVVLTGAFAIGAVVFRVLGKKRLTVLPQ